MSDKVVVYKIPFAPALPWFQRPVELQGVLYVLEFQYNTREQRWYMDILDASEQPLLRGLRLDINRNLNSQYGSYVLPRGLFVCKDTTGKGTSPTFDSFVTDHQLLFVDFAG